MVGARKRLRLSGDAWIAVVVILAAGFLALHLLSNRQDDAYFRPTTFPLAFAVVLVVFALALLGWSLARPIEEVQAQRALSDPDRAGAAGRVVGTIVTAVLYVIALPWLGYLVASAACFAMISLLFGNRRFLSIAIAAIVLPAALYLFFEKYMIVLLPSSRLFG